VFEAVIGMAAPTDSHCGLLLWHDRPEVAAARDEGDRLRPDTTPRQQPAVIHGLGWRPAVDFEKLANLLLADR